MAKKQKKVNKIHSENYEKTRVIGFKFLDTSGLRELQSIRDFIEWFAVPKHLRNPSTHQEFAEKIGVRVDTLTDWKKRTGFFDEVRVIHSQYFRRYTPDVFYALARRAIRTGAEREVRLYAELFEGFSKKVGVELTQPAAISPEQKKQLRQAFANVGLASLIAENNSYQHEDDEEIDVSD